MSRCKPGIAIQYAGTDRSSEGIYFDGALPKAKQDVRRMRLEKLRVRLENFCKLCPDSLSRAKEGVANIRPLDLSFLTPARPLNSKHTALPEPPFMVPAVVEDLQDQGQDPALAATVSVVNGEADKYCAAHAQRTGATVLSNDSDLLVFDLGQQASVLSLDSLTIDTGEHNHEFKIGGSIIRPAQIATKLHLRSLSRLAFERSRDQNLSFNNVVARAVIQLKPKDRSVFENFLKDYSMEDDVEESPELQVILDTRVSELYHQLQQPLLDSFEVYLPFLIENHARASSWSFGVGLRTVAYSLLNLSSRKPRVREVVIDEYMRSGGKIVPRPRRLYAEASKLSQAIDEVTQDLRDLGSRFEAMRLNRHLDPSRIWRLHGLYQVCKTLISTQKPLPDEEWIAEFLSDGYVDNCVTIDAVHIEANVNAALYSFRMLKQCAAVAIHARTPRGVSNETVMPRLTTLHAELRDLPRLCQLMASRLETAQAANPTIRKASDLAVSKLYKVLDVGRESKRAAEVSY